MSCHFDFEREERELKWVFGLAELKFIEVLEYGIGFRSSEKSDKIKNNENN